MKYYSTRDKNVSLSAAEAVKMGLSRDGGLLTPTRIPQIDRAFLERLTPLEYARRAAAVMALYLTDYSEEELLTFGRNAYGPAQFDDPIAAPVRKVENGLYCLELWHGPTSAFKDTALQMLPQLLSAALRKTGEKRTACILAATSGDTGKAAMAGFADVPQTCIQVYYPKNGVSPVQERQMVTQEGENVDVRAVIGNFDDAQAGVKRIFSDETVRAELDKRGYFLSSANSINWGRILPQVVYYISAYCDLVRDGAITMGDKVNFCVPTGNFGDILAAYYAKRMGLPVNKLICASNSNNVLTDFLRTGIYDRNRPFHTTISPSMDILISSNLERLLFDLSGENDAEIRMYMDALGSAGRYQVSDNIKAKLDDAFWGRLLFGGGNGENHPPVLAGSQLPHRPPYRRGGGGAGAVPRRFRGRDSRRGGLHRQSLQVLRERTHRHRRDALRRRTGAAGPASRGQRRPGALPSGGAEKKVPPL